MILTTILLSLVLGLLFGVVHQLRDISYRLEKVEREVSTVLHGLTSRQSSVAHRTTTRQAPQVDARPRVAQRAGEPPTISADEALLRARIGHVATHRRGGDIDPDTGLNRDDQLQQDRGYPAAQVGEDQGHSPHSGGSENG